MPLRASFLVIGGTVPLITCEAKIMSKRLADESERIVRQGTAAWARLKKEKNWNDWMAVGDALLVGRTFAMNDAGTNAPVGKGYNLTFNQWLVNAKLSDMDNCDRAKLLIVMENRAALEQWRATLTETERLRLNHPTSVLRKWQAAAKTAEPSDPRRTLCDAHVILQEEVHRLQRELADAKAHIAEIEAARSESTPAHGEDPQTALVLLRRWYVPLYQLEMWGNAAEAGKKKIIVRELDSVGAALDALEKLAARSA
jgi:hypothetical protein